MRAVSVIILFFFTYAANAVGPSYNIRGYLKVDDSCREGKAMVWLSMNHEQADHLLYHVSVPDKGTFSFSVRPGKYLLNVSSAKHCEWSEQVEVANDVFKEIVLKGGEQ